MKRFLIALQFLTILPVRVKSPVKEKDFGASLLYFPLVGLLIGLVLVLSAIALSLSLFSPLLKAAIILIISIIVTGGIHLDGFADTCDGFYGNKPREKILEIMRDSRVGTMGVVGIASLMLLKFSLFVSIPEGFLGKAIILMAVFSRWAQVMACFGASYARQEGKAKYFIEYVSRREILLGGLFTLALFLLLLRTKGLILFSASFFVVFLVTNYIKKKIGGMTGDTIGTVNEAAEGIVLLLSLILI